MAYYNIQDNITSDMCPQKRYVQRASMMNLSRDKRWLSRLKKNLCYIKGEGFQDFRSQESKDTYFNQFLQLMDVMERKYEDKWDVKINYSISYEKYAFSFVIFYDKVTISNTAGETRDLSDLFVFLPVNWGEDNKCVYTKLYGGRLTFKYDEWVSRYKHSHLRMFPRIEDKKNIFDATEFCIGTEDISELVITQKQSFNLNNFELLLYTIDNMVAWESTEGTPHIAMRNITSAIIENRITYRDEDIVSLWDTFKNTFHFKLKKIILNLSYVYSNNRFRIKHNEFFNDNLINLLQNDNEGDDYLAQKLICKRGIDNHFYNTSSEYIHQKSIDFVNSLSKEEVPYTYIQNKKHIFKVFDINNQKQENQTALIIYPKFLDYVTEQLEAELYKTCVRGSSINRAYTSINVSGDIGQNQVYL